MKETALTTIHKNLGAKMVEFAGYTMPVYYSGIKDEHETVRNKVGVFDVSHMGEFIVRGANAEKLIQYATSNDVTKLFPGRAQYSCFPNDKGGIIDDLIVYMLAPEEYLLVVNASNIEKDWARINELNKKFGADLSNISDGTSLIAVQGPMAAKTLQALTPVALDEIKFYHFETGEFAGRKNVIISGTGYTGSGGFELYINNEDAPAIWEAIMEAGKEYGIKPAGLGARDTLRLEMGFCLYGNDIDDTTSPLEAGLGWITKLDNDFVASDILRKQKEEGINRKLVGLELKDKVIPRKGFEILNENDEIIGEVTSGTMAPSLNVPIAMGYVQKEYSTPGTEGLKIKIRNKTASAEVIKLPFYKNK